MSLLSIFSNEVELGLLALLVITVLLFLMHVTNVVFDLYKFNHSRKFIEGNNDVKVNFYLHYIKMTRRNSQMEHVPSQISLPKISGDTSGDEGSINNG
ncbi:TPA: hypothetical protein ACGVBR_004357 [Vibrio vulnificus]|nr:hypothetical protein [Vibrio vulnificus]